MQSRPQISKGVDPDCVQFFRVDPSFLRESTSVQKCTFCSTGVDLQIVKESTLDELESTPFDQKLGLIVLLAPPQLVLLVETVLLVGLAALLLVLAKAPPQSVLALQWAESGLFGVVLDATSVAAASSVVVDSFVVASSVVSSTVVSAASIAFVVSSTTFCYLFYDLFNTALQSFSEPCFGLELQKNPHLPAWSSPSFYREWGETPPRSFEDPASGEREVARERRLGGRRCTTSSSSLLPRLVCSSGGLQGRQQRLEKAAADSSCGDGGQSRGRRWPAQAGAKVAAAEAGGRSSRSQRRHPLLPCLFFLLLSWGGQAKAAVGGGAGHGGDGCCLGRVLFPFSCEGRPGGVSRVVLFPSGVKEDQPSWVL
ncbi:hypothetical protein Taro_025022 [Colocasia esculenta]|uniref:Uncharacterized protein n=1 Tax=Colocasia esculenta TaxID=4460 RepID=A0A843VD08_COLES|nr:hypothetical protein [Colocasia esculenta]